MSNSRRFYSNRSIQQPNP